MFHDYNCVFVLYKICPSISGYNDRLDDDPFLHVGQHDAVVIGRQLQSRRAKQLVTRYGGHRISSRDDITQYGRRLGSSWVDIYSMETAAR